MYTEQIRAQGNQLFIIKCDLKALHYYSFI
jgi:hypothetical protein